MLRPDRSVLEVSGVRSRLVRIATIYSDPNSTPYPLLYPRLTLTIVRPCSLWAKQQSRVKSLSVTLSATALESKHALHGCVAIHVTHSGILLMWSSDAIPVHRATIISMIRDISALWQQFCLGFSIGGHAAKSTNLGKALKKCIRASAQYRQCSLDSIQCAPPDSAHWRSSTCPGQEHRQGIDKSRYQYLGCTRRLYMQLLHHSGPAAVKKSKSAPCSAWLTFRMYNPR
jgi:hypothetical protein